jgi:hypothetical protein
MDTASLINNKVTIIAGPCSVNEKNIEQIHAIARMKVTSRDGTISPAIWGVRCVGLKSRSSINKTGEGMGLDFHAYMKNIKHLMSGGGIEGLVITPSVEVAKRLIVETGVVIASEIMEPLSQLPVYERELPKGKVLVWNPAVNQLGYQMHVMGTYANRNNWFIGMKNGKWLGEAPEGEVNIMEKNWIGQVTFATEDGTFPLTDRIAMIQRGVDVSGKGEYRNLPVHESAVKAKRMAGVKMFYDPSHIHGTLLRNKIVDATIEAMHMKMDDGTYLYDGILVEVGDSLTDTGQHISISELQEICDKVAVFRDLNNDRSVL